MNLNDYSPAERWIIRYSYRYDRKINRYTREFSRMNALDLMSLYRNELYNESHI